MEEIALAEIWTSEAVRRGEGLRRTDRHSTGANCVSDGDLLNRQTDSDDNVAGLGSLALPSDLRDPINLAAVAWRVGDGRGNVRSAIAAICDPRSITAVQPAGNGAAFCT